MGVTTKVFKPQADHRRPIDYQANTTETSGNAGSFLLPFTTVAGMFIIFIPQIMALVVFYPDMEKGVELGMRVKSGYQNRKTHPYIFGSNYCEEF
jgi:hypothetical protein